MDMSTPAWVRLDEDDPMLGGYESLEKPSDWTFAIGQRKPLSEVYNEAFGLFQDADWIGFLADDVVPETRNFDRLLIEAAGKDGLAFGDDGINGDARAPHFVLGGNLVRSVGFLSLLGLKRLYVDTFWSDVARARGVRRYLPNVKLTHLHFSNRKALMDSIYRKPGKIEDMMIYEKWLKDFNATNRKETP